MPPGDSFSIMRLIHAWHAYRRGKRKIPAVQAFEPLLLETVAALSAELSQGTYAHGAYRSFFVCDPKRRRITAATLRDRIVHQVVYEEVERVFEPTFLDCSYSGRIGRGVHAAIEAAERVIANLRSQHVWPIYAIKLDVRKFYDSVDHAVLYRLLARRIHDPRLLSVICSILASYASPFGAGKGIPIGNLTSQIFANVYLHELDRIAKHTLHIPHYFRYADDVLLLGSDLAQLLRFADALRVHASSHLLLEIPHAPAWPRTLSRGIDWLGTVLWPYGRTLRRATRGRMRQEFRRREQEVACGVRTFASLAQVKASYAGMVRGVRDRALSAQFARFCRLTPET